MAARFGDMLLNRRRQLGMSIQQVANTVKIRPQIIEFFETGNFASMPPRGYAQGMIASYARFLGLNPRDVVNTYFDELVEYEHTSGNQAGRFQEGAGYVSQRSNSQNGRFLMVNGGRTDGSRYGQRPPQAGYVTESGSGREIREMRDRVRRTLPPADRAVPSSYQLGNRDPRVGYGDGSLSRRNNQMRNVNIARPSRQGSRRNADRSNRQQPPRSQRSGNGQMVRATSYGSSRRTNAHKPQQQATRQVNARRSTQRNRKTGFSSFDPRFLIGIAIVIVAMLALVVTLAVKGCTSNSQQPEQAPVAAAKNNSSNKKSKKKSASSSKKDSDASDDSNNDSSDDSLSSLDATTQSDSADGSLVVRVKVAKKKTAWVEVKVDGKSVYASQTTGPFDKKFIPASSVEITTSKPSFVTVIKNGKKVRYDTKTSGVARVTLTVPTKTTGTSDTGTSDSDDSSGTSQSGTSSGDSDSSSDQTLSTSSQQ